MPIHACSFNYKVGIAFNDAHVRIVATSKRRLFMLILPVSDVGLCISVGVVDHGVERLVDPLAQHNLCSGPVETKMRRIKKAVQLDRFTRPVSCTKWQRFVVVKLKLLTCSMPAVCQ